MIQVSAPVLTTDRLTLRGPAPDDFAAYAEFYGSERSAGMGGPLDRPTAWRAFAAELGHWMIHGYGLWRVEVTATGQVIGQVGFWNPLGWSEVEIGWAMYAGSEGKGYACEAATAARACVDHAFGPLGWDSVVSYIDPANARSIALAERLGASLDPQAPQPKPGAHTLVYRHNRPEARP